MWSKSLMEKTIEMFKTMDAYGAYFKSFSGEYGQLVPRDEGFEITILKETKNNKYTPELSDKKYYFKNIKEIIEAGWVID